MNVKLWNFIVILIAFLIPSPYALCSNKQQEGNQKIRKKMPVIISRGYILLDKKTPQPHEDTTLGPLQEYKFDPNSILLNENSNMDLPIEQKLKNHALNKKQAVPVVTKEEIDYEKISKFVTEIRNNLCSKNPGGSYEVWIQAEVGASLLVNLSAQTGIKAIIKCPDTGSKVASH